jgi:hypothetical protein
VGSEELNLQGLIEDRPLFHEYKGRPHLWGLSLAALEYLDRRVTRTSTTLETGAGLSTVLFALKGANHTCITPSRTEVDRIRQYGLDHGISLATVRFQIDRSDNVLTRLGVDELDLALIDGGHGFPTPFLDWYYISQRLKIGGTLIVDDVDIWTGQVLRDFLLLEPEWKLDESCKAWFEKTAVFVKVKEYKPWKEWDKQRYVVKNSTISLTGLAAWFHIWESRFWKAVQLLRQGEVLTLIKRLLRRGARKR